MAHVVKRSKISNDLCSSDQPSSSLSIDLCPLLVTFNDNETPKFMHDIFSGEQVFGIDWIREEILNYVIYDNNQTISRELFGTVRLVQKSWLSTATKLLKKCEDPLLIELTLEIINNDVAANIKQNMKLLDQFIATLGASFRLKQSYLPFKLQVGPEYFRHENYQSLSDCFSRLGDELLELEIVYPLDGGNMPVNFTFLSFPLLRKLSFQFSDNVYKPIDEDPPNFEDNKFGLWLLQSILNATKNLQELIIPFAACEVVPATLDFLHLPPTIVTLELESKLKSKTLETFFQRNPLPNLSDLMLQLHANPFEKDLIYKILQQFRKTLVYLHVGGNKSTGRRFPRTYFRFPKMEKLEFMNIYSTECELDAEQWTCLQECLPKLARVRLEHQSEAMLKKWAGKVKFESVNELIISNTNELLSEEQNNFFRSPSLEMMRQLNAAFPNINYLTIHVNIGFLNVLGCLFVNMKKLQQLQLEFHGRIQRNSSDLLDSMLTSRVYL